MKNFPKTREKSLKKQAKIFKKSASKDCKKNNKKSFLTTSQNPDRKTSKNFEN